MAWGRSRAPNIEKLTARRDIAALVGLLCEGEDMDLALAAGDALTTLADPAAISLLIDVLPAVEDDVRRGRMADLLVQAGSSAVPVMAPWLTGSGSSEREMAEAVLLRIGADAPASVVDLVRAPDAAAREAASNLVVKLGHTAEAAEDVV